MKLEEFKTGLRSKIEQICKDNHWSHDNNKQRGMAFENWCFDLLSARYPNSESKLEECVIRQDDFGIDLFFESKETSEIYILQCKHPKIAANEPIPETDVKSFFNNFELLKDLNYTTRRKNVNPKIDQLVSEFRYWLGKNFVINFVFASNGVSSDKTDALVEKFNRDNQNSNVKFAVWDIKGIRDEYDSVQAIDEQYPELISIIIADNHFMQPEGDLQSLTFAIRGTSLQEIAMQHGEKLYNWNIRRFLGRKGEVNSGLTQTIMQEPEHFYYYNNGISALCEGFDFDGASKKLSVRKLQIVNGAQTMGALRASPPEKLKDVMVLVKLTAVKHASREKGIAASLIKTNNTQNTLRAPDFRSNDKIQLWLEDKFKATKSKGELLQIDYGRKRPYPRSSSNKLALKLLDLGKIRYAWYHDPKIPISDPARLFQLPEEDGLYGKAYGDLDGEIVDNWSERQFRETLLSIHSFRKIEESLLKLQQAEADLKQITRLKYYGLHLFKLYIDRMGNVNSEINEDDLYLFGGKFSDYFERSMRVIGKTLSSAYREMLNAEEGTAFSLPRDPKVWEKVLKKFEDNLELLREFSQP
jgi:AIPR protein